MSCREKSKLLNQRNHQDGHAGNPKLLTVKELSELTNIHCGTIYNWHLTYPDIPRIKLGRLVRYILEDVMNYFDDREKES